MSTHGLKKKITLPNGNFIKYYSKYERIDPFEDLFTLINYRVTFNPRGKVLSMMTNGWWIIKRYDEEDKLVYYENSSTGEKKNITYRYDETLKGVIKVEEHF